MNRLRSSLLYVLMISFFSLLAGGRAASAQLTVVGDGGPGPVKAQHLTAELVSLAPGISPGGTLQVGLVLTLEEKWHVYWVNAGDSGQAPKIKWTLPEGITAGPMLFPIPQRLPLGPLMDFGYEDEVAFPVLLTAAPGMKAGASQAGCAGELAGVCGDLYSGQGAPGDDDQCRSGECAGAAAWRAWAGAEADSEAAAGGREVFRGWRQDGDAA